MVEEQDEVNRCSRVGLQLATKGRRCSRPSAPRWARASRRRAHSPSRGWPDRGELGDQFGGKGRLRRRDAAPADAQIRGIELRNLARLGGPAQPRPGVSPDGGPNRYPPRRRSAPQDERQSARAAQDQTGAG